MIMVSKNDEKVDGELSTEQQMISIKDQRQCTKGNQIELHQQTHSGEIKMT